MVPAYHEAESCIITTKPINNHQTIGVSVRWPEKRRSILFSLIFLLLFVSRQKVKKELSTGYAGLAIPHFILLLPAIKKNHSPQSQRD